jgi:dihydrofolate reductase
MELGLIDEFRLFVAPVILGGGKPLFRQVKDRIALKRLSTTFFDSGTVLLAYSPQASVES